MSPLRALRRRIQAWLLHDDDTMAPGFFGPGGRHVSSKTDVALDAWRYRLMRAIAMQGDLEAQVAFASLDQIGSEAVIDEAVDAMKRLLTTPPAIPKL